MTYAPSLTGGFVYEDVRRDTAHVYQERWHGWASLVRPRGLSRASHALTTSAFGDRALAARAVSLAWHVLNGLLLWLVARTVLTESAATIAAGLFWLHPIQSEAVASVAYRSELVAAMWLLLALWCVSRGWLVAACLVACAAVTGKEAGIVAIALVPLWAAWTRDRRWLWLAVPAAVVVGLVPALGHVRLLSLGQAEQQLSALTHLLSLVAWPDRLTIDHDWQALTARQGADALAVVLLLGVLALVYHRSIWALTLAWTIVAVLPRLIWNLGEGLHEHHLYVPMIAVSLAMASAVAPSPKD